MEFFASVFPLLFLLALLAGSIILVVKLIKKNPGISEEKRKYDLALAYATVKLNQELKEGKELEPEEEMKTLIKHFNDAYDIYGKL